MIETGLVYVHSTKPTRRFVGCGALIEGGYVATCRHVWRMATKAAAKTHPNQPLEVEIEFPGSWQGGTTVRHVASLIDSCEPAGGRAPDLVLLLPTEIPGNVIALQLATENRFEIGEGYARAGLQGRDQNKPQEVRDVEIRGEIADYIGFDGRRQFTGDNPISYWSIPGSSGSPVFRKGGQQLAGILSLSELGALHEAFVVPATTIRRYLVELVVRRTPTAESINPDLLRPILETIGETDVPVAEIPNRLKQFVDAARGRAGEPVQPSNDGADIDATIGAARAKLGNLDTTGARAILAEKIAEEETARRQRLIPLLEEESAIERLGYDYDAAKASLQKLLMLDPERTRSWIELGDLFVTTGGLDQAANAFRHSLAITDRLTRADLNNAGWQRDLAVSYERIGNVQVAQGALAAALESCRTSLAIRERLAQTDPGNAGWQRDLSVS
jgi:tetratricopeptide (TPR) repeat protein